MIQCPHCGHEFTPVSSPLTKKQLALFRWIEATMRAEGQSPTIDEISKAFGLSLGTTHEHVAKLQAKGALTRDRNLPRSIKLLVRSDELLDEMRTPEPSGDEDEG